MKLVVKRLVHVIEWLGLDGALSTMPGNCLLWGISRRSSSAVLKDIPPVTRHASIGKQAPASSRVIAQKRAHTVLESRRASHCCHFGIYAKTNAERVNQKFGGPSGRQFRALATHIKMVSRKSAYWSCVLAVSTFWVRIVRIGNLVRIGFAYCAY